MKIIFMGTPAAASTVLAELLKAKHEVLAVVTQPDRPQGRGQKIKFPPVKELALKMGLPVEQPEKIKGNQVFVSWLKSWQPEVIVVVAYGRLLPPEILAIPPYGCLNVHASLLPKYRGAAPVQWALLNGELATGITIMRVEERLDAGAVMRQEKVKIETDDNAVTLTKKLFDRGAGLLLEALAQLREGRADFEQQDETAVSYAPAIGKESGAIDWRKPAVEISNRIRALIPWPMAYTYYRGKTVKIWQAELFPLSLEAKPQLPGRLEQIVKDSGFVVATGSANLLITEIQPEGGKRMKATDFVNGHHLKAGDIFPS